MDKIIIEKMQFYAYHGVFEEENKLGQKFEIDLEMYLDLKKAGDNDCLEDTVHYGKVYEAVKHIVTGSKMKLLESLAEKISDELLKSFLIDGVLVRVRKLNPPIHGYLQSVSVEIKRGKTTNE